MVKNDIISRQAAIEHLKKRLYETALNSITEHPYYEELADNRVDVWLNELPSAEQHGKWIDMGDFEQCSECHSTHLKEFQTYYGKVVWIKTPYCPYCGTKMNGEQNE